MKLLTTILLICVTTFSAFSNIVTGETLNSLNERIGGVEVVVLENDSVIAHAKSNGEGNFQVEFKPSDNGSLKLIASAPDYIDEALNIDNNTKKVRLVLHDKATLLEDVVVTGRPIVFNGNTITAYPSRQNKSNSRGGLDLLIKTGIPTLVTDPFSKSVKSMTGMSVAYYIDFIPATPEEVQNIRTQDVDHIDYLSFSVDPRFKGNLYVVNFITADPTTGGYSKAMIEQTVINNEGNYNLYSKLSHKKMTYDVSANYKYKKTRHWGNDNTAEFLFENGETLTRTASDISSKYLDNLSSVSARAVYQNDNMSIVNKLSLLYDFTPYSCSSQSVEYNVSSLYEGTSFSNSKSKKTSPIWQGDYNFYLPKNFSLSVSPSFSFLSQNDSYSFSDSETLDFINNTQSKVYRGTLNFNLTKNYKNNSFVAF